MKSLVITIPSNSPQEDRMTYVKAILHSVKVQRNHDLPTDTAEHNNWLLELANHLLPNDDEMMLLERCLEESKKNR